MESFFYYLKIKDYNVVIGSKNFFHVPEKNMEENYDISINIVVDQGCGYSVGFLLIIYFELFRRTL